MSAISEMAISIIRAEDDTLADIMLFVRTLNGKPDAQAAALDVLLTYGAVAERHRLDAVRDRDFIRAFSLQASMYGAIAIAQKATEEWERYDREEGKDGGA